MIVKKTDQEYPQRLRLLDGMPDILYGLGEWPQDQTPALAIVGARTCSHYGENMAYEYAKFLSSAGVQIISGMARGIDSAAHAGALAGGGKTFAVLGCGVDICYPASSRNLYEKIQKQGGILSEYEMGTPPLAYHFPRRNRIISGLADGVLIIEAKEKSGSLITADFALEQGKAVFALPGRVGDLLSYGCNRLIYQGATPAWCPEMILEEMNWGKKTVEIERKENGKKELGLAREDNLVYSCLNLNPKAVTQLQEETGFSSGVLMNCLTRLLLNGYIKEVWKNNYIRKSDISEAK
ncbi:MAG: DNA-processing protein DprA [Ruminococcus sp.]|nr:DNA-processing protein DprA [Ruminococcus sp.]